MALLKKQTAAEPFHVPSLDEASKEYADLRAKQIELHNKLGEAERERIALRRAIAADTSREIPSAIAEILGDAPGNKASNRKRVAELSREIAHLEEAIRIVGQRIRDSFTDANRAACAAVKPEFDRLVAKMVDAMRVLDAAHRDFDDLCLEMDANELQYGHLGPRPHFLGNARDGVRRIAAYIKETGNV
jgi:hypothetical protein